ncbi:MAG TPA: aldolase/citrate lyase family protein [Conexibacter sp.]
MPAEHRAPLAERLRAGERLAGLIVKIPGPQVVECAGHSGYDLVVIDTEHGPADTEALEHHLRAAASAGIPALVRVSGLARGEVLRALDAGADGVVVPQVENAAAAAQAVALAHYPPRGARGLATSTRAGRHCMTDVREHVRRARERTLVIAQVEDVAAVPHAAAIAAEPGIDGVFLGPTDLSMSLGHPGELSHPRVAATIDSVTEQVQAVGGAAMLALVGSEQEARAWWGRGAQVVLFVAAAVISKRLSEIACALDGARAELDGEAVLEEVGP